MIDCPSSTCELLRCRSETVPSRAWRQGLCFRNVLLRLIVWKTCHGRYSADTSSKNLFLAGNLTYCNEGCPWPVRLHTASAAGWVSHALFIRPCCHVILRIRERRSLLMTKEQPTLPA
jgi:hypothetical protein